MTCLGSYARGECPKGQPNENCCSMTGGKITCKECWAKEYLSRDSILIKDDDQTVLSNPYNKHYSERATGAYDGFSRATELMVINRWVKTADKEGGDS